MTTLDDLTIVIKTFERPRTLKRGLDRIRRFYPGVRILVADDSAVPASVADPRTEIHPLPFDTGLSAGRNYLLSRVETPYVLLNDDDQFFSRQTDVEAMVRLLDAGGLDIVGGRMWQRRRRHLYLVRSVVDTPVRFEIDAGTLRCREVAVDETAPCTPCDLVPNFFVAPTERLRAMGGWDPRLKIDEHIDFFLRVKRAGLRVGYTTRSSLVHVRGRERSSPRYLPFRQRAPEFRELWMREHGLATLINRQGTVITDLR